MPVELAGLAHWNVMLTASVKLLVTVGFASRYQAWKFQVSPGSTWAEPIGVGMSWRFSGKTRTPVGPDGGSRSSVETATAPPTGDFFEDGEAVSLGLRGEEHAEARRGQAVPRRVRSFREDASEPRAVRRAVSPVELDVAGQK